MDARHTLFSAIYFDPIMFVGGSTKSHLLDSLMVYLNNRDRQQPIIGLHGQILIWGILYVVLGVCACVNGVH